MRSRTPEDFANRCRGCFLRLDVCLCGEVPRVPTRSEFLVLRHQKEVWLSSNTGRLVALALPNSRLVDYGTEGSSFVPGDVKRGAAWLLFPGEAQSQAPEPPPGQVVVLDGSWAQAKRMLHRIPALRGLPVLTLPAPGEPLRKLRQPPVASGLSTLEAVARAVGMLEGEAAGNQLLELHRLFVRRALSMRGLVVD